MGTFDNLCLFLLGDNHRLGRSIDVIENIFDKLQVEKT
jgi:hypothetical protein